MLYVRLYTNWHTLKESTFNLPRKYDFFFLFLKQQLLWRCSVESHMIRLVLSIFSLFYYLHFRNEERRTSELMGRWSREEKVGKEGGGWVGGGVIRKKKKLERKTDKECQALKTGMLLLCVCHLATSPPHHLPPAFPSPAALSNSTNLLRNVWLLF